MESIATRGHPQKQKLSILKVIPYTVVYDTSVLPYPLQVRPLLEGGGSISSTIS